MTIQAIQGQCERLKVSLIQASLSYALFNFKEHIAPLLIEFNEFEK